MTVFWAVLKFFRATWWIWAALALIGWAVHWHTGKSREAVNAAVYEQVYRHVYALEEKRVKQEKADAEEIARLKVESEKVTERVVVEYRDRIKVIHDKAVTIIEKVPVYVTPENDAACPINRGFVSLWDHANAGTVPGAPSRSDGETSGIVLSEVERQHAREAEYCRSTETQLIALQSWVTQQSQVH